MTETARNRVLVVGPSWVGDMVMAQALFKVLASRPVRPEISVLAPAWSLELLDRMPEVDLAIESPFQHGDLKLWERYRFARQYRHQFDEAIVLPNSFKSALIPYMAGIPVRIGWRGEARGMLLTDCRRLRTGQLPLMVQRFVALGFPEDAGIPDSIPLPQLQCSQAQLDSTVADLVTSGSGPILAICPGAEFGSAKQWPVNHFGSLAEKMIKQGWRVWILGSNRDAEAATAVLKSIPPPHSGHCFNLTGRTTLVQAADLLATANAVVSNDSGLMHVAAAVDAAVVALFGPTSPDFTPPLGDRVKLLTTDISCRPCFARECPLGHKRCLTELHPDQVVNSLHQLVSKE